ncbi:hypothetical protein QQ008_27820 [Fulvivirgaceae bacterium BMA10]|uniref:DUF3857 domain-containing protein n=1 Tax=Splendidivirga corallicola TaxID=3051826 RepID=A0ABT8KYL6_9BACT|nr:hypothetical protein [Fulvivirgaceae bacterium BMA10]
MKISRLALFGWLAMLFVQCHSLQWNQQDKHVQSERASESVLEAFAKYPNGIMKLKASTPGYDYAYDVAEKDVYYGKDSTKFHFKQVEIRLHETMPAGQVIVDFTFLDDQGNKVNVNGVDLIRLTPKLDSQDELIYAELLLEEFNRFGVSFRKEHEEFNVQLATSEVPEVQENAYRCSIVNNCLAGTKWEFALNTTDYSDFKDRIRGINNLNQNRLLAHSWFYLDRDLYNALMHMKNPQLKAGALDLDYDSLSVIGENTVVDFEKLRKPVRYRVETAMLEVGHQSNRVVKPLDIEEHFKAEFGLLLNNKRYTYKTILEEPISLTQFRDRGFYFETTPKVCDFNWMKYVDNIEVDVLDIEGSNSYVQLTLNGQWSPYKVTIGNVDLALIDEQKLFGLLFGVNAYPKSRRYNPSQNTIVYDAELLPDEIKPFVLLTDNKSGKWINNQYKGIEKIYLTYESLERDVLNVYVLSYERITPVWMGRVKLPKKLRQLVRVRRNLYNY